MSTIKIVVVNKIYILSRFCFFAIYIAHLYASC